MTALTRTVRDAIRNAPVSIRDIARRAGVSHVLLVHIMTGKRAATWVVAQAIASGLTEIANLSGRGAARIERSLKHQRRVTW